MRSRTPYCSDESSVIQRYRIKLGHELPLVAKILICQGVIDDVTLAFSDDGRVWGEIYSDTPPAAHILKWLEAYAQKRHLPLDQFRLNLSHMTPFSKQALNAIVQVPFGTTCTYGDIASMIGNAKSCRAIGGACHHNPFPLIIPCHRIVTKNGIGGFAYPVVIKQSLLDFEQG